MANFSSGIVIGSKFSTIDVDRNSFGGILLCQDGDVVRLTDDQAVRLRDALTKMLATQETTP